MENRDHMFLEVLFCRHHIAQELHLPKKVGEEERKGQPRMKAPAKKRVQQMMTVRQRKLREQMMQEARRCLQLERKLIPASNFLPHST